MTGIAHNKNNVPENPEESHNSFWMRKRWMVRLAILIVAVGFVLPYANSSIAYAEGEEDTRPNIVLFVVDDAGYSDFGPFGGEPLTPAIDTLADIGMKFTNFHVLPTCSPTRATLLSGVDNHINGMGVMFNPPNSPQTAQEGYVAYMNDRVVAISTLLQDAGYHTYTVGKWHLGEHVHAHRGQTYFSDGWWPIDRGFERSYGMLDGGGDPFGRCTISYWPDYCTSYYLDDHLNSDDIDADYFSGQAHMEKAIEFIEEGIEADAGERKPFFLYHADTMAHGANSVPDEFIKEEYVEHYYDLGWDGVREERFERMKELGLIPESIPLTGRSPGMPAWNDEDDPNWETLLSQVQAPHVDPEIWGNIETVDELKWTLAKKFAVYAGMVEFYDYEMETIIARLKELGEYENTVFLFFSDNGGDVAQQDVLHPEWMARVGIDNSYENIGRKNSYVYNGIPWAQVTNVPFRSGKGAVSEGGIRAAMIAAYPGGDILAGEVSDALTHVTDIAATVLDYAGVEHPVGVGADPSWASCTGTYGDRTGICPLNGTSLRGIFTGEVEKVHVGRPIGTELFGATNKALYLEEEDALWKILRLGVNDSVYPGPAAPWGLYNITDDPSEAVDLSAEYPEKFSQMIEMYNQYERNVGFIAGNGQFARNVEAGSTVPYIFEMTNMGESAETFEVACHSMWSCTVGASTGDEVDSVIEMSLEPGEAAQIELSIMVPEDAEAGSSDIALVSAFGTTQPQFSQNFSAVTTMSDMESMAYEDEEMDELFDSTGLDLDELSEKQWTILLLLIEDMLSDYEE
ncbi:MAG: sulfatase-like hydrolase/transferase [Chloroflexota bacterium]